MPTEKVVRNFDHSTRFATLDEPFARKRVRCNFQRTLAVQGMIYTSRFSLRNPLPFILRVQLANASSGRQQSHARYATSASIIIRGNMKQKAADEYTQIDQGAWAPFPDALSAGGIRWKLLHISPEAGTWTA